MEMEAEFFSETSVVIYQQSMFFVVTKSETSNFAAGTVFRESPRYISGCPSFRTADSEGHCSNLWQFASEAAKGGGAVLAVPQVEISPPENEQYFRFLELPVPSTKILLKQGVL
jgi:hypothetical protein